MKTFDRKAKLDLMEAFSHEGWQFLCSGEQLPSGAFQATVRYRSPPDGQIRTLVFDAEQCATAEQALAHAKRLATEWVAKNAPGDGEV